MLLMIVALVLVVGALPANAGTPKSPEVRDACGAPTPEGREPVQSWEDICSAWFRTAAPSGGVVVTLKTGALQPRTPTFHSVVWQSGSCHLQVVSEDSTGPASPAVRELIIQCGATEAPCEMPPVGGCTTYRDAVRVPLDGAVVEGADTIRFTVRRGAVPAAKRYLLDPGAEVSKPLALTGPVVAGQTAMVWGPCEEFRCDSKVGDWTPGGRTFVIGR
jgi:hypothetical protein